MAGWFKTVGGPVVSVLLIFYAIKYRDTPPMIYWCIFAACFVIAGFVSWRGEWLAKRALQAEPGPRLSINHFDYNDETQTLEADLNFQNEGAQEITIISVSFVYREKKSDQGWELYSTGPKNHPFVGHTTNLKIAPHSSVDHECKAHLERSKFTKVGAVAGVLITYRTLGRNTDQALVQAMEVIESNLTTPGKQYPTIDRLLLDDISRSKELAEIIQSIREDALPRGVRAKAMILLNRVTDY